MDRIISSFKNLFKGEGCAKAHWITALLFVLPCLTGAVLSYYDEDTKSLLIPLMISAGILFVLSIVPMFMLSGFYIKFLNKRFNDVEGIPSYDASCILQGLKVFPIYLVWLIYIGIPVTLLLVGGVFGVIGVYGSENMSLVNVLSSVLLIFLLCLILILLLFLISPFVSLIFIKYAQNFEYTPDLFNPLTVFRNMKASFKDAVLVALKFIVVNIVTSFATQIVIFIFAIILFFFGLVYAMFIPQNSNILTDPGFIISVIIFTSLLSVFAAYVQWITSLAYADNMVGVYKKNFMTAQLKLENIGE